MRTRIYVASLSDYNAGRLHGTWIVVESDVDAVWAKIREMLEASPEAAATGGSAEEWEIHDYEGWPVNAAKYSIESLVEIATGVEEHGEAYLAWVDDTGNIDHNDLPHYTVYGSAEDLGYYWHENSDIGDLGLLEHYVNWREFGEALINEGEYSKYKGRIYGWS